jgi:hypothetical protein
MVAKHVAHCSVAKLSLKDFGKQYRFQDISRLWNLKSSGVDAARNRTHLKSGIEGHFIGVWLDSQSRPIGAVGQFEVLLGGASQTNERVITCNSDIVTSIYYDILAQLYKYTWRIISYELWVINHVLLGILISSAALRSQQLTLKGPSWANAQHSQGNELNHHLATPGGDIVGETHPKSTREGGAGAIILSRKLWNRELKSYCMSYSVTKSAHADLLFKNICSLWIPTK